MPRSTTMPIRENCLFRQSLRREKPNGGLKVWWSIVHGARSRLTFGMSGAGPSAWKCKQDAPSRVHSRPLVSDSPMLRCFHSHRRFARNRKQQREGNAEGGCYQQDEPQWNCPFAPCSAFIFACLDGVAHVFANVAPHLPPLKRKVERRDDIQIHPRR